MASGRAVSLKHVRAVALYIFALFSPVPIQALTGACGDYNAWKNPIAGCPALNPVGNPTGSNLGGSYPHRQQIGQFATYSGPGYGYVISSSSSGLGSLVVTGIPAGSTVVRAFLFQVGSYFQVPGLSNGAGYPVTASTLFATVNFSGPVTGRADLASNYDHPVFGDDLNDCTQSGAFNARFDVTSRITGNGVFTYFEQSASATVYPSSTLVVIYSDPNDPSQGTVSIADGLFFWNPQVNDDPGSGSTNDGMRPIPVTMDFSCAQAICDPTTAKFSRNGSKNQASAVQEYTDTFLEPGTLSTVAPWPVPRYESPLGVLNLQRDLNTYLDPGTAFRAGDTQVVWNLGGATRQASSYYVNVLVFSHKCPNGTPTETRTFTISPTVSYSPTQTPVYSPTATMIASATATLTVWPTDTVTRTPTPSNVSTQSSTPTPNSTLSWTPSATSTATLSWTDTNSPTHTPSASMTASASPSATVSPSTVSTETVSGTPSQTPMLSATLTGTPSSTPGATFTMTPSLSLTIALSQTQTLSPTQTELLTPTHTPSVTATEAATATGTPSWTPGASFTMTPSLSSTIALSQTHTLSPTQTALPSSTSTPSATVTVVVSETPSLTGTLTESPSSTRTVTLTPTIVSTASPSATNTPSMTSTITHSATTTASGTPTMTPSLTLTPTFTPSVTSTSTVTAAQSATNTPTVTPSPSSVAASTEGKLEIEALRLVPQPNPRYLYVQLKGSADRVKFRVWSKALNLIREQEYQFCTQGWNRLDLPQGLIDQAANGVYFYSVTAFRGEAHADAPPGRMMILK